MPTEFSSLKVLTSRFSKISYFFDSSSSVTLAEGGTYQGVDNIFEYIKFATPARPFILTENRIETRIQPLGFDTTTQSCTFLLAIPTEYELDGKHAIPYSFTLVQLTKVRYNSESNKVEKIFVYYTKPYLEFIFGHALRSRKTFEYVCSVMKNNCDRVYQDNGIQNLQQCILQLQLLPPLTTGGYFDGDDTGCRILHAVLAETNNFIALISHSSQLLMKGILRSAKNLHLFLPKVYFRNSI